MNRPLFLALSLLVVAPALAGEPTPAAPAPEKAPAPDRAAAAKEKKALAKPKAKPATKPAGTSGAGASEHGQGAAATGAKDAKPPPCEEVKPCSID